MVIYFPEPCQPTGLMVSGSCHNENVKLDWSKPKGASLYEVTISGHLGYSASFQTNDTTIETDLPCGQRFNLTVQAKDDRCDSAVSPPEEYKTGAFLFYAFSLCHFICNGNSAIYNLLRSMYPDAIGELHTLRRQSGFSQMGHECRSRGVHGNCNWRRWPHPWVHNKHYHLHLE